jgi:hypothetical protein
MTDRELIDLAAKAADLGFVPSDGGVGLIGGVLHAPWNPLHDDADAFRLAVKLGLELGVSDPFYERRRILCGQCHTRFCQKLQIR